MSPQPDQPETSPSSILKENTIFPPESKDREMKGQHPLKGDVSKKNHTMSYLKDAVRSTFKIVRTDKWIIILGLWPALST